MAKKAKKQEPRPILRKTTVVVGYWLVCDQCESDFEAKHRDARFCDDSCRYDWHNARRKRERAAARV